MSSTTTRGGYIALLNLPANTSLSIDGSATKILWKDENLLVLGYLPSGFHFLTVRAGSFLRKDNENINGQNGSSTNMLEKPSIGLAIYIEEKDPENFFLARVFDPVTEELSSKDSYSTDDISFQNLKNAILQQSEHLDASKLIHYNAITQGRADVWAKHLTNFIDISVLQHHQLTGGGDKVIAGSYSDYTSHINQSDQHNKVVLDGVTPSYDPIPCIDTRQRFHAHSGTKQYLAKLDPSQRTNLLMKSDEGSQGGIIFERVFKEYYHWRYQELVGSMQLSFVGFLCCSCLASLEHWRDMIYMVSFVDSSMIQRHLSAFEYVLSTLNHQIIFFGDSVLEDDIVEWEELLDAIRRLCKNCMRCIINAGDSLLHNHAKNLMCKVNEMFRLGPISATPNDSVEVSSDSGDEDEPIVVSLKEFEEAMSRQQSLNTRSHGCSHGNEYAHMYPFLFASICPGEDVLMACARILDEQNDVTLVREAAHYLDHVESKK